jgi:hypothetical protein
MARPMSLMIEDWMPFGWLIEEKQARAHHQPAGKIAAGPPNSANCRHRAARSDLGPLG